MYWLRDWEDIDRATVDAKRGKHEAAAGYNEYAPIVTIPLSRESLNLVSSSPCFSNLFFENVEKVD